MIDAKPNTVTRRQALTIGGMGTVALVGLASVGRAAEISDSNEAEKKNIALVNAFCKAFNDEKPDLQKIVSYMTEDVIWKQGALATMKGRAAVVEKLGTIFKDNARVELLVIDTFARGNMVAHTRVDTRSVNGGPYTPYAGPIGSVFYIRDGKIAEWLELLVPSRKPSASP